MSRRTISANVQIKDQPPSSGCYNCGGRVRWQKQHPIWGRGWYCYKCVRIR